MKRTLDWDKYLETSARAVSGGIVMLKNDGALPLKQGGTAAVFGRIQLHYYKSGTGSGGMVNVSKVIGITDGLLDAGYKLDEQLLNAYREWDEQNPFDYGEGWGGEPWSQKEMPLTDELVGGAASRADAAIVIIGRTAGEEMDNKLEKGAFLLSDLEEDMLRRVTSAFDKTVVLLNTGGLIDMSFMDRYPVSAVMYVWQGGMVGGAGTAAVLTGEVSPSGKLPDTIAYEISDYPSDKFFGSGDMDCYGEDIYVGYRYFETIPGADKAVNYPFGYGLSYTTFERALVSAEEKQGVIRVRVNVTNTGKYPGKEVMQLYAQAPQGVLGKAKRVLAAFEKTRLLAQGETQLLTLEAPVAQLASYDDLGKIQKSAYVLEKGKYQFYLGTSVRETEQVFCFTMPEDTVTEQLTAKLVPTSLAERMLSDGSFEKLPQSEPNDPDYSAIKRVPREESDGFSPAVRALPGHQIWSQPYKKDAHIFMEVAEGKITLDEFVTQMTDEELAHILGGQPNTGVANTFGFGNMPEYGIPNIMTADGPAGLRIEKKCGVVTTAWPCATLLACTWNPDVLYQVGAAGAAEVKENNIAVWLTPAVNIHRSPLCGRNFEYYSEDPYLTGKMASAMVKGIQSKHIAATVKHFACNNKETNRKESDSRVSERAAREIYLKAFEIIVKEADPWCIMSSYNIVNGHRTSENRELLEDILRGEWNYQGMVTTDWWTSGEHYKEVKAGNDIKMACGFPESLLRAKEAGVLTREEMEICAKRILGLILKID